MMASRVASAGSTSNSHPRHPGAPSICAMIEPRNSFNATAEPSAAWNSLIRMIAMTPPPVGTCLTTRVPQSFSSDREPNSKQPGDRQRHQQRDGGNGQPDEEIRGAPDK